MQRINITKPRLLNVVPCINRNKPQCIPRINITKPCMQNFRNALTKRD